MAKFKPPRRLFKGRGSSGSGQTGRARQVGFRPMTRDQSGGLEHVEFALAAIGKATPDLDDRTVLEALQLSLKREVPDASTDPKVADLLAKIDSVRETRDNVSYAAWAASLRTV